MTVMSSSVFAPLLALLYNSSFLAEATQKRPTRADTSLNKKELY